MQEGIRSESIWWNYERSTMEEAPIFANNKHFTNVIAWMKETITFFNKSIAYRCLSDIYHSIWSPKLLSPIEILTQRFQKFYRPGNPRRIWELEQQKSFKLLAESDWYANFPSVFPTTRIHYYARKWYNIFANVGVNLARLIPKVNRLPLEYLKNPINNTFYLSPITPSEECNKWTSQNWFSFKI